MTGLEEAEVYQKFKSIADIHPIPYLESRILSSWERFPASLSESKVAMSPVLMIASTRYPSSSEIIQMIIFINLDFKESKTVVLTLDWEHSELEALTHPTVTRLKLNPEIVALSWGCYIWALSVEVLLWPFSLWLTTHDDRLLGAATAWKHRRGLSFVRPAHLLMIFPKLFC